MQIKFCHLTPSTPTHTDTLTHSVTHFIRGPTWFGTCLPLASLPFALHWVFPIFRRSFEPQSRYYGTSHTLVASLNFSSLLPPHWCDTLLTSQPLSLPQREAPFPFLRWQPPGAQPALLFLLPPGTLSPSLFTLTQLFYMYSDSCLVYCSFKWPW